MTMMGGERENKEALIHFLFHKMRFVFLRMKIFFLLVSLLENLTVELQMCCFLQRRIRQQRKRKGRAEQ